MKRVALILSVLGGLAFPSAAKEPTAFELRWNGSGDASVMIDPQHDGDVVVSSSLPMADASVPLADAFCIQKDPQSRENCRREDHGQFVRLLSMKWIMVRGSRYLLVAWSVPHTCTADEPTHYFKVVDGDDFSRELGFAAKVWRPRGLR